MTTLEFERKEILRHALLDRAAMLRGEIGAVLEPADDEGGIGIRNIYRDTDDEPVADAETSVEVAGLERDARELAEVDDALRRLDSEDFGTCRECGEAIAWRRLRVQPQATRCIQCETLAEHVTVQPRSL